MKKYILLRIPLLFCLLAVSGVPAFAYTLDGNLSDWGVTPFSDWVPQNSNIDYVEYNNRTPSGAVAGGEFYDIEALYLDDDADYIYFALVSSYNQQYALAGDLGLSLDSQPGSEYGLAVRGMRPQGGVQQRDLRQNPNWYTTRGMETRMQPGSGASVGSAQIFYRDLGRLEGDWTRTYVMEGRIDRDLFGTLTAGQYLDLHFAVTCANDYINLRGDLDYSGGGQEIPEPSTSILLTAGLLGLRRMRKRK